jgi:S-adenosylmethionine:tRNA ribosyltransferase-isomerase
MAPAGVIADAALPSSLEAGEPPEARGLRRDAVRLLVSDVTADTIEHARFHDLPRWLRPGDLLVVNTSATLNAALPASTDAGDTFEMHLSTQLPEGFWTVEMRQPGPNASLPFADGRAGTTYRLPAGGRPHRAAGHDARRPDARHPQGAGRPAVVRRHRHGRPQPIINGFGPMIRRSTGTFVSAD